MTDDARKEQPPNFEEPAPTVPPKSRPVEAAKTAVPASEPPANGVKSAAPPFSPTSPAPVPVNGAASAVASSVPATVLPLPEKDKLPATGDLSALRSTRQLSDITNNKCPTCGLVNRVGVLVCENCGTSLLSGAASVPSTRSLQDKGIVTGQLSIDRLPEKPRDIDMLPLTTLRVESKSILETAQSGVTENTILKLEIAGTAQPLMVLPKREVMVGRKDLTTGTLPDLDLTPFAGYRMGVSRRHAVFRMYDRRIEVVDLGSSNGSRLNGILMHAHQPYLLRDGDLLTFGKMEMRVSFHNPPPRINRL